MMMIMLIVMKTLFISWKDLLTSSGIFAPIWCVEVLIVRLLRPSKYTDLRIPMTSSSFLADLSDLPAIVLFGSKRAAILRDTSMTCLPVGF